MRIFIITVCFLIFCFKGYAQDNEIKELIVASNKIYSSSIELLITAGEQSQKLEGNFTMNEDFQYMSLSTAEFFTFNGKQIKVSNEEKKLAVYKTGFASLSNFLFSEENVINFHFPSQLETIDSGYQVVLIPIDNMKTVLGRTTIKVDKDYKIQSILYVLPESNPFGITSLELSYFNRTEKVDLTKSPNLFFEFKEDQLVINKAYTNYTILQ